MREQRRPASVQEVIKWIEQGAVSPAEAFRLFEQVNQETPGPREQDNTDRLKAILRELDGLMGLDRVKELVREIQAFVEIQRRRAAAGLIAEPLVLHMIFKGNPGTGKTTVARIFGRLFREMGVLEKGHLIEAERADLVGEYIGHTAQKTRDLVKKALGGILFIDEAYALARGGEKDFGKEAIDTLVKAMEDHKESLILILAGYQREMEYFLRTNPGLRSRFPIHIDFPDYAPEELLAIAELMVRKRQYRLSPEALEELTRFLREGGRADLVATGNARFVRNLIEKAIRRQAVRLVRSGSTNRDDLMTISMEDLEGCLT